jgi:hypothetical protein
VKNRKMVTVRCECGEDLLLMPDLEEMGRAIEDHVDMHLQCLKAPGCTPKEAKRLKDALIAQIITIASLPYDEENR